MTTTTTLPNIRSLFLPDPGYCLVEVDLKQADAQVVAWESDDAVLKSLFRRSLDIYTETQTGVWDDPQLAPIERQRRKNIVHSSDYGAGWRTLSDRYIRSASTAKHFIARWFAVHPAIREWQQRVQWDMQASRTPIIYNVWGYRRMYASVVPITQPLAWIGQSTVSITINRIMRRLRAELPWLQLLLQVHDSILAQVPHCKVPECFPRIQELCVEPLPFKPEPLVIPTELKWSSTDWGHMEKWHD